MKLTPMDINNKEFKKGLRGYNSDEVDEFLDEVIENYEELYKENSKLKEKITVLNEQIDHYAKIESTIQNTLLLAQNAADQAKESSQKEAELVVKNANETAQKIVDKAHNDVIQINDEFDRIKQEFIKFRVKFRNFMNTQLETFDDLERDLNKNYSIATPIDEFMPKEIGYNEEVVDEVVEDVQADDLDEIKSFFASDVE
ncbi:DivIVA domain-containing protein [Clostridium thermobutyricum]|uniref:DivIVA domain-containing protein n=2 Tax=Clostridium thermobutyricum TaxID=29372 RepID=N9XQG4_9CLOT|nr:DivIVA domain-containing protein [Clostridium thermobutyricum]ENZ01958.1 DivIVA domain-containing protein [Clostridium thermobutyricum]OPX47946.1 septum site-determining protein DivIVA [Clostridium thermobutyricum DSM 4928]